MKRRNYKSTTKAVAAILCAVLVLTACGNQETVVTETLAETAAVEPGAAPTEVPAEPTTAPTEAPTEPTEAASPAPAVVTETGTGTVTDPVASPAAGSTAAGSDTGYTYTELNQTMYAKSAVNVRDLPGTEGNKIGSLKASQEITVTGKCDQTGWYQLDLDGTTAYVSDKYIVAEKPAATANSTTNAAAATAPAQNTSTGTVSGTEEYFDRAMAEQVFALVNAERTANGLNALTWSEDLYDIAVQRCYENDRHAGMRAGTSENYSEGQTSADEIYQSWHDSPGHHDNYMNPNYVYSAVGVRVVPLLGGALGCSHIHYQIFTWDTSSTSGPTIVQDTAESTDSAPANESTGSSNVGWSLTPPTQEDGLKKWQEQNPDAEVSFGN